MRSTFALALVAGAAYAIPAPSAVTSAIAPSGSPLCSTSYDGTFEISAVTSASSKRDLAKRDCSAAGSLVISLTNGVLTDSSGRTGYIASNDQFQFDKPPQAGAKITAGFSACSNGSLALGDSAVWWQCLSGSFYNLYDSDWAAQCKPILFEIVPCSGSSSGQLTQISDGQPQAASATPITQITDGQPQGPTGTPPTVAPITQISDGQPQAPTVTNVITQISDGQPQAPTATASATKPVITQISDGQPQAPTATASATKPVITQISDGQPQAPTATATTSATKPVITQISDGQPQAPATTRPGNVVTTSAAGTGVTSSSSAPASAHNITSASSSSGASPTGPSSSPAAPSQVKTGAGSTVTASSAAFVVLLGAVALLL